MQKYEVVIVGAGTAGLMLARELGNQNHKVLILDRKMNLLEFSFNTLGSFIDIEKFGFTENVVAQKIDAITIYSKHVKESVKINGYTLDKRKVHEELIASLNMDFVDIKLGIHIKDIVKVDDQYTSVIDKEGNEYNAKIFVDASGTAAVLSKKIGFFPKNSKLATGIEYNVQYLGNDNEAHLMIGKDYKGGYGWIFPLKNKRAIIGFGTFDESMVKGLKANLHTILELPNIKKLVLKDNDKAEGGSIPITPVLEKFVSHNFLCVGDSVSQVNPVVGEGYKFIFESAIFASKAIYQSLKNEDVNLLLQYESDWKKRFLNNYKRSKKAQERIFSTSKNDILIDIAMLLFMKLRPNYKNVKTLSGEYE